MQVDTDHLTIATTKLVVVKEPLRYVQVLPVDFNLAGVAIDIILPHEHATIDATEVGEGVLRNP